jgi:hypothetical protein
MATGYYGGVVFSVILSITVLAQSLFTRYLFFTSVSLASVNRRTCMAVVIFITAKISTPF